MVINELSLGGWPVTRGSSPRKFFLYATLPKNSLAQWELTKDNFHSDFSLRLA